MLKKKAKWPTTRDDVTLRQEFAVPSSSSASDFPTCIWRVRVRENTALAEHLQLLECFSWQLASALPSWPWFYSQDYNEEINPFLYHFLFSRQNPFSSFNCFSYLFLFSGHVPSCHCPLWSVPSELKMLVEVQSNPNRTERLLTLLFQVLYSINANENDSQVWSSSFILFPHFESTNPSKILFTCATLWTCTHVKLTLEPKYKILY